MMVLKMIKACIFDLDGTLVDTLKDLSNSVNYALEKFGFNKRTYEEYLTFIGNGSRVLVSKAIGREVSEKLFKEVFDTYLDYYEHHLVVESHPYEGIKPFLGRLKERGIKIACLTNKPHNAAKTIIEELFPNTFDIVLGNSSKVKTKPDLEGYDYILKTLNVCSENVMYCGDSDVDMIVGRNAKVNSLVACAYGYRPVDELLKYNPDYVLQSSLDFEKIDLN